MHKLLSVLGIFLLDIMVLCVGCQHSGLNRSRVQSALPGPQLKESEAVQVAAETAKKHGRRMEEYKLKDVRYDSQTRMWLIRFVHVRQGFTAFHVQVNDKTRDAPYLPRE
jgi:hypothetical protein